MFFTDAPIRRRFLVKILQFMDLGVLVLSFSLATIAVHYHIVQVQFKEFLTVRLSLTNVLIFLSFFVAWHLCFLAFGLYHSKRLAPRWSQVIDTIKATSAGTVIIFIIGFIFKVELISPVYNRLSIYPYKIILISPIFLIVFWLVSSSITLLGRLTLQFILYQFRIRGRNLRCMLIVGTNQTAVEFGQKILRRVGLGYELAGFVDSEWIYNGNYNFKVKYPLIPFKQFTSFLRENIIDEVIICLPVKSFYDEYSRIIDICEEQGVIVRFLSDVFGTKKAKIRAEQFEDNSVITIYTGAMEGFFFQLKRIVDIFLSFALIIVLSPVFIIIALMVKVSSSGPVFFSQERIGLAKRRFRLIKFRTMIPDAEKLMHGLEKFNEVSGPVFKMKNDPRITSIGRFLRKTSLDELPQLFNVFLGDMSIVGPRPLPVRDYEGFDADWHRRRFTVRPGITCTWQVEGRNDISFDKWMELDLEYIDNWSPWLDFKILIKTIPTVLKGSGH